MARIPIEPAPKRTPWWAWLLGLVVLAGLVFLLLDLLNLGDGRPNTEQAGTQPPTDLVITDIAALAGATSESDLIGRQVNVLNAQIAEVVNDSLVFINVTGAGVASNDNVAQQQGLADSSDGQTPALGGATGVAVFGDRLLVVLDRVATGSAPGTTSGLQPGQSVAIEGQVESADGNRVNGMNLSGDQQEQVEKSGLFIRASRISQAAAGQTADTTRS